MAADTGIKWTDSTYNSWWGCTKVEGAPACIDCYAEDVDKRGTAKDQPLHWGRGAPRRRISEKARNEPIRWNRNADKFFLEHGRRQRVFTLSMGDLFDNEVDNDWRAEHLGMMEKCDRLEWQPCTKRISNLPKMVPASWHTGLGGHWPKNIGMLITVVTQKEADRDIPRLLDYKRRFNIPWVGISYEPAQDLVDFSRFMWPVCGWWKGPYSSFAEAKEAGAPCGRKRQALVSAESVFLDWIIFGGKSGGNWNDGPFDLEWARKTRDDCEASGTPFFMKQVAAFQPNDSMIPADLMVRQWPRGH